MDVRIVVIEDDPVISHQVAGHLRERTGASVDAFPALAPAKRALSQADLVALDLNLPDSDGLETVRSARLLAPSAFLIVITARSALADRVGGLRLGADDYLVKPFSLLELEARVEALLRRRGGAAPPTGSDLSWDVAGRRVRRTGEDLGLTPLEYEVFGALAARPGQALSRVELLRDVLGPNFYGYERVIDVHVGHLRKKLDPDNTFRYIGTVRHYGYRWDAPAPEKSDAT